MGVSQAQIDLGARHSQVTCMGVGMRMGVGADEVLGCGSSVLGCSRIIRISMGWEHWYGLGALVRVWYWYGLIGCTGMVAN